MQLIIGGLTFRLKDTAMDKSELTFSHGDVALVGGVRSVCHERQLHLR
jgi:hypothetical protein